MLIPGKSKAMLSRGKANQEGPELGSPVQKLHYRSTNRFNCLQMFRPSTWEWPRWLVVWNRINTAWSCGC